MTVAARDDTSTLASTLRVRRPATPRALTAPAPDPGDERNRRRRRERRRATLLTLAMIGSIVGLTWAAALVYDPADRPTAPPAAEVGAQREALDGVERALTKRAEVVIGEDRPDAPRRPAVPDQPNEAGEPETPATDSRERVARSFDEAGEVVTHEPTRTGVESAERDWQRADPPMPNGRPPRAKARSRAIQDVGSDVRELSRGLSSEPLHGPEVRTEGRTRQAMLVLAIGLSPLMLAALTDVARRHGWPRWPGGRRRRRGPLQPDLGGALGTTRHVEADQSKLEDVRWLRERYVYAGASQWEMAEEIGCTLAALTRAMERHGIPPRPTQVSRHPELARRSWVATRLGAGWTVNAIAHEVGATPETVTRAVQWHGLG